MSNDGRVIINIDSNAKNVARDFNTLDIAVKNNISDVKRGAISYESFNKSISGATERLRTLALHGYKNSAEFQNLAKYVKTANKELTSADNIVNKAIGNTQGLASSFLNLNTALGALSAGYVTNKIIDLGKSAINTSMDFQALTNRMNAAAGNKSIGADSLAYIREQADRLGLEFRTTADSFAGFEAAALRSGLTLEQTKQIFSDVSTAATSMQLSTDRVQLVFKALEQISGKGTVSMEELRQQLGDQLPGAFEIAAQSMGMTTKAFYDAVANGEVLSSEFLPKFAKAIKEQLGGSAEEASAQLRASLNRLNTDLMDSSNAWGTLLQPSVQKGVEALREAAQASTQLANALKFSPEITSTATAIAAATTATFGLSTALRAIPPILLAVRSGIMSINLASLLNPIGLISAAVGGVTYVLVKNKLAIDDTIHSTDLFKESLNQETSEAVRQLREYGELINIKNKTNSQVERLKELTEELTSKYPKYIDKLRQELTLKGKISQATAEQIANEITLAKVKDLQEKKVKLNKSIMRDSQVSTALAKVLPGAAWANKAGGRYGIRKSLQIQQDELEKQLKAVKDNRQKIIKKLTSSYDDYSLAPSIGGLGSDDDKTGKSEKVKGPFALLQEAATQAKTELDDLAAKGITSGKVWDSQVAKVNNLSAALERVKQATDLSVIPPFQALNTEIQKAQERVNNLAASKIVNLAELKQAKTDLTALEKKMFDIKQTAETSPYQQKQNALSNIQSQYLDLAILGEGNSPAAIQLKNLANKYRNEIEKAQTSLQNSVGLSWKNISNTISSQLSYALTTPLQEGENAFERLGNVALNVIGQIAQAWLSNSLNNMFSGSGGGSKSSGGGLLGTIGSTIGSIWGGGGSAAGGILGGALDKFFADGAPLRHGRVVPFAGGGVVGSPTMFPMSGNRTGLMGERGAEAIMPLKRTPSGQLGVQAQVQQPSINIYNQSGANIETVQRPDGETDIFIRKVNSALKNERTQAGFSSALQRNQSRGVQAS